MKKTILTFLAIIIISTCISANNDFSRNSIKLYFAPDRAEIESFHFNHKLYNFQFRYSRYINRYLSLGAYAGYGIYNEYEVKIEENHIRTSYNLSKGNSILLGVQASIHFLPMLFTQYPNWLDLYSTASLGQVFLKSRQQKVLYPAQGNYVETGVSMGLALNFTKNFGIFTEAGYKHFEYQKGFQSKFGLSIRF